MGWRKPLVPVVFLALVLLLHISNSVGDSFESYVVVGESSPPPSTTTTSTTSTSSTSSTTIPSICGNGACEVGDPCNCIDCPHIPGVTDCCLFGESWTRGDLEAF